MISRIFLTSYVYQYNGDILNVPQKSEFLCSQQPSVLYFQYVFHFKDLTIQKKSNSLFFLFNILFFASLIKHLNTFEKIII